MTCHSLDDIVRMLAQLTKRLDDIELAVNQDVDSDIEDDQEEQLPEWVKTCETPHLSNCHFGPESTQQYQDSAKSSLGPTGCLIQEKPQVQITPMVNSSGHTSISDIDATEVNSNCGSTISTPQIPELLMSSQPQIPTYGTTDSSQKQTSHIQQQSFSPLYQVVNPPATLKSICLPRKCLGSIIYRTTATKPYSEVIQADNGTGQS